MVDKERQFFYFGELSFSRESMILQSSKSEYLLGDDCG